MKPFTESTTPTEIACRRPTVDDGTRIWEIARDSRVLDLNSSYSYLLWCRDFHDCSVVAELDGRVVGFVTGYVRRDDPSTLFVWQVAVDESARGHGVAAAMLNELLDHLSHQGITRLETTISPDNGASIAMFTSLARHRYTTITKRELFTPSHFPDAHESEELYIIGDTSTEGAQR
ncbi:L-2,4-diaminobutyric acid acetyltransferase [Rhodococcus sp. RD6.2]|uniref:diaminobutyrate acetyltransferase n=1 Tax=Rhodococcus sp. RD6.2 TaxID=260936 RepID=UPI00063B3E07|nr:diaminobutyrate acetyltransferase [Rhodococcus sp. RD6.2]CRK54037.1 L-2,4-diaminobutyric acid acetyltransferase [Rhodococcus sp. RD6.2]